jgi:hypothetical protein
VKVLRSTKKVGMISKLGGTSTKMGGQNLNFF